MLYSLLGSNVLKDLKEFFTNYISEAFSFIPKIMYLLCASLLSLIDVLQLLFRKLAGLDVYFIDGVATEGDMLQGILQEIFVNDSTLNDIFWGMVIIGAVLLFLATLVAVIRSQYVAEDANTASLKKIFNNVFKSIINFVFVPAVCIFGVYLGNVILQAIDSATTYQDTDSSRLSYFQTASTDAYDFSVGDTTFDVNISTNQTKDASKSYKAYDLFGVRIATTYTPFSGIVFRSAAYSCSRVRTNDDFANIIVGATDTGYDKTSIIIAHSESTTRVYEPFSGMTASDAASLIDEAFANNYMLKTDCQGYLIQVYKTAGKDGVDVFKGITYNGSVMDGDIARSGYTQKLVNFSKYRVGTVWYFYDLWTFDFVVAIGSIVIMVMIFFNIIMGLIKRMFELAVLAIVSPAVIGISPLDNGEATKKWRQEFVKKTISIYSAVVAMNLIYPILDYLNRVTLFTSALGVVNYLIDIVFVIAGLTAVKGLIAMLSGIIGAEDINESGGKFAGEVMANAQKVGSLGASMATAPLALGKSVHKIANAASFGKLGDAEARLGAKVTKSFTESKGGKWAIKAYNSLSSEGRKKNLEKEREKAQQVKDADDLKAQNAAEDDAIIKANTFGPGTATATNFINYKALRAKSQRGDVLTATEEADYSAYKNTISLKEKAIQRRMNNDVAYQRIKNDNQKKYDNISDDIDLRKGVIDNNKKKTGFVNSVLNAYSNAWTLAVGSASGGSMAKAYKDAQDGGYGLKSILSKGMKNSIAGNAQEKSASDKAAQQKRDSAGEKTNELLTQLIGKIDNINKK